MSHIRTQINDSSYKYLIFIIYMYHVYTKVLHTSSTITKSSGADALLDILSVDVLTSMFSPLDELFCVEDLLLPSVAFLSLDVLLLASSEFCCSKDRNGTSSKSLFKSFDTLC